MVRTLNGLAPCTPYDAERLAAYGVGREVDVTLWQERSVPHHRLYWVLLNTLITNSEGKYLASVDLHEALKVALGITRKIKLLTPSLHAIIARRIKQRLALCLMWICGLLSSVPLVARAIGYLNDSIQDLSELETDCDTITMPGSTGFQQMDQAAFKVYFEAALDQLRKADYPVDAALAESRRILMARTNTTSLTHQPAHSERDEHVPPATESPKLVPSQAGDYQPTPFGSFVQDSRDSPQGSSHADPERVPENAY